MGRRKALKKLHEACFLGDVSKVQKILKKSKEKISINDADSSGYTCLHIAARWGHTDLANYLIDDQKAAIDETSEQDGDTPLHIALTFHHLALAEQLIAKDARLDIPNAAGVTCQQLIDSASAWKRQWQEWDDTPGGRSVHSYSEDDDIDDDYVAQEDSRRERHRMDAEEEKRFRERMWEEMDNDDSYLHDFEEEGFSSRKQTDEEWRESIASAMRRKRQQSFATSNLTSISASASYQTSTTDDGRRRKPIGPTLDEDAKRNADRIIREELKRDAALKSARRSHQLMEMRQQYEQRRSAFENRQSVSVLLSYQDVPWPAESDADIKDVMVCGIAPDDNDMRRIRVRTELRIWHPDKWPPSLFLEADSARILERIKVIAQILNSELKRE